MNEAPPLAPPQVRLAAQTVDLVKHYRLGHDVLVQALRGVSLERKRLASALNKLGDG